MRHSSTGLPWYFSVIIGVFGIWLLFLIVRIISEYRGAYGRWRRNEPLSLTAFNIKLQDARHEQRRTRRIEIRREYEAHPQTILNLEFRREFEDFGLDSAIRSEVYARDGMRCQLCGRQFTGRMRKPELLHIDHIRPRKLYPHLIYIKSNLQLLCRTCNAHKHDYDGSDWKEVVNVRKAKTVRKRLQSKKKLPGNDR